MVGFKVQNTVFGANAGWQLLPVLSPCTVDVAALFEDKDVIIVKEVGGWNLYWPEFGINSLGTLSPGKAYFLLMASNGNIEFPACGDLKGFQNLTASPDLSAFKISTTPVTHIIAIPAAVSGNLEI